MGRGKGTGGDRRKPPRVASGPPQRRHELRPCRRLIVHPHQGLAGNRSRRRRLFFGGGAVIPSGTPIFCSRSKLFTLSDTVEFMVGLRPDWTYTTGGVGKIGAEVALDSCLAVAWARSLAGFLSRATATRSAAVISNRLALALACWFRFHDRPGQNSSTTGSWHHIAATIITPIMPTIRAAIWRARVLTGLASGCARHQCRHVCG